MGLSGLWSLSSSYTKTKTKDNPKFPFNAGKSLDFYSSSIMPNICALATLPVQVSLGAGWSHIQLTDHDNLQTYGSFRYGARVGHYTGKGLIGGVEGMFSSVKQKVNAQSSSFATQTIQASLGWQW
jgi:hypothetical protein